MRDSSKDRNFLCLHMFLIKWLTKCNYFEFDYGFQSIEQNSMLQLIALNLKKIFPINLFMQVTRIAIL